MFRVAFWSVAAVLAVAIIAMMLWLLWMQAKRLMAQATRSSEAVSRSLARRASTQELTERGTVSMPRDVDAFADKERIAELRAEQFARRTTKETRKQASREKAYARWAGFNR